MKNISIKVLNPESIANAEKMMVFCARLTQRGEKIKNIENLETLYERDYTDSLVKTLTTLPHPTIQKFGVINVAIVGASRRFLAQITRHQNEVKFMSASLQYSNYSGESDFVIPYELINKPNSTRNYLEDCYKAMTKYHDMVNSGLDNDSAGYIAPQSLRNVLIISATPYQWKHMIKQRTCNRNTKETQYCMLRIWEELYKLNSTMFEGAGPFCTVGKCLEGKMCCGRSVPAAPIEILKQEFSLLYKEDKNEN